MPSCTYLCSMRHLFGAAYRPDRRRPRGLPAGCPRALEAAGIRVVGEAADGESAITEAERLRPQLVLLDVQLPGIDGFEVAARLGQASDPPAVVLTSSHAASSYRRRLARSPARAFIPKDELSGEALAALMG